MRAVLGSVVFGVALAGCAERCATPARPQLQGAARIPLAGEPAPRVDLLLSIDNSSSMAGAQARLARNLDALVATLVDPPRDPVTMRPLYPPVRSLHLGVVSSDLGTPGSVVPSCANPDAGDDGLLHPIRYGLAMWAHPPWRDAPPGRRPARCRDDAAQLPAFLVFDAAASSGAELREEAVCVGHLAAGGCDLAQQLESVYRALVVHDSRAREGNADPNAGFVRDRAFLGIVVVTDGEDGSARDCRFAERGVPCDDATSVFDLASTRWASPALERRFDDYAPGSAQDPTWAIDRYIDPRDPARGFTSLKPGRPDLVFFAAIAGVPIQLPTRADASRQEVDWDALLGRRPDGADGYAGMSAEGSVSMRRRDPDPACPGRVIPACRAEGSAPTTGCGAGGPFVALPSRRVAQVARRFAERYQSGSLTSICRDDYTPALRPLVERALHQLWGRCLPRPLEAVAAPCEAGSGQEGCVRTRCVVRELLPPGVSAATACVAARGRTPGERDAALGRDTCVVRNLAAPLREPPPAGHEGFYYTALPDPWAPDCATRIAFTRGAELRDDAPGVLECVQRYGDPPEGPSACE